MRHLNTIFSFFKTISQTNASTKRARGINNILTVTRKKTGFCFSPVPSSHDDCTKVHCSRTFWRPIRISGKYADIVHKLKHPTLLIHKRTVRHDTVLSNNRLRYADGCPSDRGSAVVALPTDPPDHDHMSR